MVQIVRSSRRRIDRAINRGWWWTDLRGKWVTRQARFLGWETFRVAGILLAGALGTLGMWKVGQASGRLL